LGRFCGQRLQSRCAHIIPPLVLARAAGEVALSTCETCTMASNVTFWTSVVVGTGLLGLGTLRLYRMIDSASWGEVSGEVLESSTTKDCDANFWPQIKYQYSVNGQRFIGETISVGGLWGLRGWYGWVHDLVTKHRVGSSVRVLYNPRNPSVSCLKRDGWVAIIGLLIGGLVFLYVAYTTW